jgi:hypothetical protein
MFQYLPLPAAKEIRHSVSSVTLRIVMKDDGVRCQLLTHKNVLNKVCCASLWSISTYNFTCPSLMVHYVSKKSKVQYKSHMTTALFYIITADLGDQRFSSSSRKSFQFSSSA